MYYGENVKRYMKTINATSTFENILWKYEINFTRYIQG